jgi:CRP-like cAMP-binding protein
VIIPNSTLTRSQVTVLGRRRMQPVQLRRWIYFKVDFRAAPNDVIDVIERALRAQPISNVALEPAPNCIAVEFEESATKYAVRYWLTELSAEDPTDSQVRNRIYYALARANLTLSIPAQTLFVTAEDAARRERKRASERESRMNSLRRVDLFLGLSDDELSQLAGHLRRAPFARDETITREGADAHHLYIILSGEVSVRVGGLDPADEVGRLRAGDFFGEMALLTGEKRRATAVALSDVDCYRLDAAAFRELLARRADLAERVAQVLAERQTGLTSAKERMNAQQKAQLLAQHERAFLSKIKAFFELD